MSIAVKPFYEKNEHFPLALLFIPSDILTFRIGFIPKLTSF